MGDYLVFKVRGTSWPARDAADVLAISSECSALILTADPMVSN